VRWQRSALLGWLRANPPAGPLYSNYPDVLAFHGVARAAWLPWRHDPNAGSPSPDYPERLQQVGASLRREQGVILLFDRARRFFPERAELERALALCAAAELDDGVVLASAGCGDGGAP
jgi:hypothetical protein